VVDFNGPNPCAFFGSSNLATGGEVHNGDSLVKCTEPAVVSAFAVEAVRLIDHFHFRGAMTKATAAKPLTLQGNPSGLGPDEVDWWKPYYDSTDLKCTERNSLAQVAPAPRPPAGHLSFQIPPRKWPVARPGDGFFPSGSLGPRRPWILFE
jgi:hypothetical protein